MSVNRNRSEALSAYVIFVYGILEGIEMKKFIATLVVAAFSMGAALVHAAPALGKTQSVMSVQHGKHKKGTHKKHKKMHKKMHRSAK